MIYRNYIGLDLQASVMRAVSMQRRGMSLALRDGRLIGLDQGVLTPSFKSENVSNADAFVSALREVLDPIAGAEERVSLALPERAGRILLAEVETPLVNRVEGVEVLKWQLRDLLPADNEIQLDYQVVARDESGRQQVVVACVAAPVLRQYEDLLNQAGYGAERVTFRSLCQASYYRNRLGSDDDFILILSDDQSLVMQVYQNKVPVYHRSCDSDGGLETIYRELSRVLSGERSRLGGLRRETLYLHSNRVDNTELVALLQGLFEKEAVLQLDPDLQRNGAPLPGLDPAQSRSLVAAIGAAELLL